MKFLKESGGTVDSVEFSDVSLLSFITVSATQSLFPYCAVVSIFHPPLFGRIAPLIQPRRSPQRTRN